MTPSDDILDLLGRYATGSLTEEERQRLLDAALNDQELFEELAREQELKMLLDQPGARDRMIRALEPPKRRMAWILGLAATAALSVALVVVLSRPAPKPPQIAVAKIPPPTPIVQPESVRTETKPSAPKRIAKAKTDAPVVTPQPPGAATETDQLQKDATKKEADVRAEAAAAPPPAPSQNAVQLSRAQKQTLGRFTPQQQGIASGPRQMQQAADAKTPAFGFHYSLETKGHLIVVPGADGYLSVTSDDGTALFSRKQIAAAIRTDIAIPDTVNSVSITFSQNSSPVGGKPVLRDGSSGNVEGASALAVEIKVK